jgi:hypothetical protein
MIFSFFLALSADGANVAFLGSSDGDTCFINRGGTPNIGGPSPTQEGIYLAMGDSLSVIANENTPIPGGGGDFSSFLGVSADGGNVVFQGAPDDTVTDAGIYFHDGTAIQVVADRNTPIPGGTGNFETFSGYSVDGDSVVFHGRGRVFPPQEGVYLYDGTAIRVVADQNTVVPGGAVKFSSFSRVSTEGGDVAFVGSGPGHLGVFLDTGGSLSIIADVHTPMPNGGLFEVFDHVSLDGGDVTFEGGRQFEPKTGIYRKTAGGSLSVVSDFQTPIPGRSYSLNHFGGHSMAAESVAFHGSSSSLTFLPTQGVYLHDGDTVQVVADTLTPVRYTRCSSSTSRKRRSR